jgi:SAM-dependent methyltransferase
MADVYATIAHADVAVQERLVEVLELRAADAQQRAMLADYLDDLELADDARVLDVGCGTGAVTRALAARLPAGRIVGVDPSAVFVEHARTLGAGIANVSFEVGDGRDLPFEDASFDAVVYHTSLCHIPGPEQVLAEARRVTAAGGRLAIFDGDYETTTVAISPTDPLQACAEAAIEALVHDRFLVRRLPGLVRDAGWQTVRVKSHGYVEAGEAGYMLTIVDRGADALADAGRLDGATAEALKQEARRRGASGSFFGHIAYASLIARR